MNVVRAVAEMQACAHQHRFEGKRIGVVPTMGYLHDGHLSLVGIAHERCDKVVVTIFVNPTQFAPDEDLMRYPRDVQRDLTLLEKAGADTLFMPDVADMYPPEYHTFVEVEKFAAVLEGKARPTHFRGVMTVVAKLFNITKPHIAVFGQKDAQQLVLVKQMVRDLNFDIEIVAGPIIREPDGLAMSSRNIYLSRDERKDAPVLSQSLSHAREMIRGGERNAMRVKEMITGMIRQKATAHIDYVSVADDASLVEVPVLENGASVLISLAVRFGSTRLIDNITITIE